MIVYGLIRSIIKKSRIRKIARNMMQNSEKQEEIIENKEPEQITYNYVGVLEIPKLNLKNGFSQSIFGIIARIILRR